MAKRRTLNFPGVLARPIDPWRDNIGAALEERRFALMAYLGIDPRDPAADIKAVAALSKRGSEESSVPVEKGKRGALLAAASSVIPGFRLTSKTYSLRGIYAARHRKTRSAELPPDTIVSLVRHVDRLSPDYHSRASVKRAINSLTEIGQPFSHLKRHRYQLEMMYYRHRHNVVPTLPSLKLCPGPDDISCFAKDPYFDEAPGRCKLRSNKCPFWMSWKRWEQWVVQDYAAEHHALKGIAHYRHTTMR